MQGTAQDKASWVMSNSPKCYYYYYCHHCGRVEDFESSGPCSIPGRGKMLFPFFQLLHYYYYYYFSEYDFCYSFTLHFQILCWRLQRLHCLRHQEHLQGQEWKSLKVSMMRGFYGKVDGRDQHVKSIGACQ